MQLCSEVAEPYVAHASLVELHVVGDTVGTTQLHTQCIGIGQDVTVQLRSEVAEPYVAHASWLEVLAKSTKQLYDQQTHHLELFAEGGMLL